MMKTFLFPVENKPHLYSWTVQSYQSLNSRLTAFLKSQLAGSLRPPNPASAKCCLHLPVPRLANPPAPTLPFFMTRWCIALLILLACSDFCLVQVFLAGTFGFMSHSGLIMATGAKRNSKVKTGCKTCRYIHAFHSSRTVNSNYNHKLTDTKTELEKSNVTKESHPVNVVSAQAVHATATNHLSSSSSKPNPHLPQPSNQIWTFNRSYPSNQSSPPKISPS